MSIVRYTKVISHEGWGLVAKKTHGQHEARYEKAAFEKAAAFMLSFSPPYVSVREHQARYENAAFMLSFSPPSPMASSCSLRVRTSVSVS